jgi:hypothetical protein
LELGEEEGEEEEKEDVLDDDYSFYNNNYPTCFDNNSIDFYKKGHSILDIH